MSKIMFSIEYAGLQLQVAKNEKGEDVTPLKPISDLFGLSWSDQHKKINGDFYRSHLGICIGDIPYADGQKREQICILVSRIAAFLMSINPEKVRAQGNISGAEFLEEKLNEWADALHDYEQLGVAVNLNHAKSQELLRKQRAAFAQMMGVKARTEDQNDRQAITQVLKQMAGELGVTYQSDLLDDRQ